MERRRSATTFASIGSGSTRKRCSTLITAAISGLAIAFDFDQAQPSDPLNANSEGIAVRYYFDIRSDGVAARDHIGRDFDSPSTAIAYAREWLRDCASKTHLVKTCASA
jgi:hypothetical protein